MSRRVHAVILLMVGIGLMVFAVLQHLAVVVNRVQQLALYLWVLAAIALVGSVACALARGRAVARS